VTDGLGTRTLTTAGTSVAYTASCGDGLAFCDPGTITASVIARNANGEGPSASGSASFTGPFASALPAANASVATSGGGSASIEGDGDATVQLSPPADWASFNGTCSYSHSGNLGGADGGSIACNATSLSLFVNHGIRRGTGTANISHSVTFTATNRRGSVRSETFSFTVRQQLLCPRCQIP